MNLKTAEIAKRLKVSESCIRKYKGVYRWHQSYYWGITQNADFLINLLKTAFPEAEVVDSGNHYHSFVGSAKSGSAQDSFFWVKFKLPEKE